MRASIRSGRGFTMIATLITVVLILILAVVLFKGSSLFAAKGSAPVAARPDGKGTTTLGAVKYAAEDDVCRSNLNQVREAITLFEQSNDDKPPQSLSELKIGSEFYSCPIGHEPYKYDPSTGQVHCVHPGHEGY